MISRRSPSNASLPPLARGGWRPRGRRHGAREQLPTQNHPPRHRSSPGSGIATITARPGAGVASPSSPSLASAWLLQAARAPPAESHRLFSPLPL